jgi:hypothetical protein
MKQAWRWFGPNDPVTLDTVRQAGATDIVSALHHVPPGEAWTLSDVERHRNLIESTPPGRSPWFYRKSGAETRKDQVLVESSCGEQIKLLRK